MKFSLRDMLLLVLLFGLALGWFSDRNRLATENDRLATESRNYRRTTNALSYWIRRHGGFEAYRGWHVELDFPKNRVWVKNNTGKGGTGYPLEGFDERQPEEE